MESLFSTVGYLLFGRKWILWGMRNGLKSALFVNEMEIKMNKVKLREIMDRELEARAELEVIEKEDPFANWDLAPGESDYKAKKKLEEEHKKKLDDAKDKLKMIQGELSGAEGEMMRINNITYHNRLKYDFIKSYDLGKHEGYAD